MMRQSRPTLPVRRMTAMVLAPAVALMLSPVGPPVGATPGPLSASLSETEALARCRGLVGEMPGLPDASTTVTEAEVVGATARLPAYCQVKAVIRPHVGIHLRLPTQSWNHKFLEYARGGFCRPVTTMGECDNALRKGYACVISDDGNQTSKPDDIWAYDDTQAKVDCGFRGTHVAAVAGKALTEKFYGERPRHAYLAGCSTGGRMAMVEATRFPYDFDGIVAGAPPINKFYNSIALAWNADAVLDETGKQVIFPEDLRLLHAAVLAQCDSLDGLKDGIISDPHACKPDLSKIACAQGQTAGCLDAEKLAAVRKIYQGPVNSKGQALYNGAPLPGSELTWIGLFVTEDGSRSPIFLSMNDTFRSLAYPSPGDRWDIHKINWDSVAEQVSMEESFYSGANPDLRRFKAAGGKLIAYQGLSDPLILPDNFADYYETVEKTMGGRAATLDFFRLFQPAGLNHCIGGAGAGVIDFLSYLEDWVEKDRAPSMLIAAHLKAADASAAGLFPTDPANILFTRPVFPYPMVTRYSGQGSSDSAASFVAGTSNGKVLALPEPR